MLKNWSLTETLPSSDKNVACSDNPRQSIWNKKEKSSKLGQRNESFISSFTCFLTAITKF